LNSCNALFSGILYILCGLLIGVILSGCTVYINCLLFMPHHIYIPSISPKPITNVDPNCSVSLEHKNHKDLSFLDHEASGIQKNLDVVDPLMFHPTNIKDFYFPRVVPLEIFTKQQCEWIVQEATKMSLNQGHVQNVADNSERDLSVRSVQGTGIHKKDNRFSWVLKEIVEAVVEVNDKYWNYKIPSDPHSDLVEHLQFHLYNASSRGHYKWHQDVGVDGPVARRVISIVVFLSDTSDYEGGELQVIGNDGLIPFDNSQGHVVIFPSFMMHQVTTVTKGVRCTFSIWIQSPIATVENSDFI